MRIEQSRNQTAPQRVGRQYAGTPGKGPKGKTCKQCQHVYHGREGRAERAFPKCLLVPVAQRLKLWTGKPACEHWEPISGLG